MKVWRGIATGCHLRLRCLSAASASWYVYTSACWESSIVDISSQLQVRSVYRTIELSEGYQGHLTTTEKYFYLLDLLPLLVALVIYIPFWPGRYIPNTLPTPNAEDDCVNAGEKLGEGTLTELEGRPLKASE